MDYLKHYYSLVISRKSLERDIYLELHHIIPKSIFGKCMMDESKIKNVNDVENTVYFSAREHFVAHWLLHRAFPNSKQLQGAFWAMCLISPSQKRNYIPSSRAFEEAREAAAESRTKSIAMYNLNGDLIDSFNSVNEAARITNNVANAIGQAANGYSKSCGGYQWRLYEDVPVNQIDQYEEVLGNLVSVGQYDLDGNLLANFESYEEAERELGISDSQIRASINRNSKPKSLNCFFRRFDKNSEVPLKLPPYIHPCSEDSKPIVMLSANYTYFIKRFKCIKYAQTFLKKSGREQISRVCNGERNTAWGYGWMWEKDYDLDLPKRDFDKVKLYEHSKKINCYDLNGQFIKTFDSMSQASKELLLNNISRSATQPNRISGQFQFKYFSEVGDTKNIDPVINSENIPKKIFQLELITNNIVNEFNSIGEAARHIGDEKYRFNISNCIKGKRKSAYGYNWREK